METNLSPHLEQPAVAEQHIQGHHFYPAGVIALYCALSLPIGLGLYGLNSARRGVRFMGYLLAGISAAVFLGMTVCAALGTGRTEFSLFPIVLGFGLYGREQCPYQAALRRGGLTAKWWPPLLWILGLWIVVAIMVTLVRTNP